MAGRSSGRMYICAAESTAMSLVRETPVRNWRNFSREIAASRLSALARLPVDRLRQKPIHRADHSFDRDCDHGLASEILRAQDLAL